MGKDAINKAVKAKFGIGLRRIDVARLKDTVLLGRPKARTGRKPVEQLLREEILTPEITARAREIKVARIGFDEAFHRLVSAGFLPLEIRNIFSAHGAPLIFDTAPFRAMLQNRRAWFATQRKQGLAKDQIALAIRQFYAKPWHSPFEFLRVEYKPRKKVDFRTYRAAQRRRARENVVELYGPRFARGRPRVLPRR